MKKVLWLFILLISIFIFFLIVQNNIFKIINNTQIGYSEKKYYFQEDFESYKSINDLLKEDLSKWHNIQRTLNSNMVEISSDIAHSGNKSLKTFAIKYEYQPEASKANIQKELLNFKKGDNVWISSWFYIKKSTSFKNIFLIDIEDQNLTNSPGRRIYLGDKNQIISDLGKWYNKSIFRQELGKEVSIPQEKWFNIKLHLFLSENNDGILEVRQDNFLILSGTGQTLPTKKSIYSKVQIGITANGNEEYSQSVYIDDIIISNTQVN